MTSDQEDFKLSELAKPKSDQLNADDLIGGPITVTITKVRKGDAEQPTWVYYEGDNGKPWKSCKSMTRLMIEVWGDSARACVGKSVTLFRDPAVTFGKDTPGGIRVSHMSHIDRARTVMLTASRGKKKPYTVQPLVVQQQRETQREQQQDKPTKERGNFDSARVALEVANAATVESIMVVINEKAWTKNERAEIKRLCDEAKTRETTENKEQ